MRASRPLFLVFPVLFFFFSKNFTSKNDVLSPCESSYPTAWRNGLISLRIASRLDPTPDTAFITIEHRLASYREHAKRGALLYDSNPEPEWTKYITHPYKVKDTHPFPDRVISRGALYFKNVQRQWSKQDRSKFFKQCLQK